MRHLAALVLALAVAGCGGDDALSTEDYRAEAREICIAADRESKAIEEPTRATNAAIVDYFERLLATTERSTERFKALEPPDELADDHDAAVGANEAGADAVRELIGDLEEGGDPRQILTSAQGRLQALSRSANEAAQRLGVPECSG